MPSQAYGRPAPAFSWAWKSSRRRATGPRAERGQQPGHVLRHHPRVLHRVALLEAVAARRGVVAGSGQGAGRVAGQQQPAVRVEQGAPRPAAPAELVRDGRATRGHGQARDREVVEGVLQGGRGAVRLRPAALRGRVRHVAQAQVLGQPRPGPEPALPRCAVRSPALPVTASPRGRGRSPRPPKAWAAAITGAAESPFITPVYDATSGQRGSHPPSSAARCSEPTRSEATSGRSQSAAAPWCGRRPSRGSRCSAGARTRPGARRRRTRGTGRRRR